MYVATVILLMGVLPVISILIEFVVLHNGADLVFLIGKWFSFWCVGILLIMAGLRQIANPTFIADSIFRVKEQAAPDASLLLDMLLAARDARGFISGLDEAAFIASRLHQNALIRSPEVIGEAAGKIAAATQPAQPDIPWRRITGMRHRLIHGYAEVRLELVWVVVQENLDPLIATLAGLLPEAGGAVE